LGGNGAPSVFGIGSGGKRHKKIVFAIRDRPWDLHQAVPGQFRRPVSSLLSVNAVGDKIPRAYSTLYMTVQ